MEDRESMMEKAAAIKAGRKRLNTVLMQCRNGRHGDKRRKRQEKYPKQWLSGHQAG